MNYLIDTHTFLWFVSGSTDLSQKAKATIESNDNSIFISIASLWEISIKTALGKLQINGKYETVLTDIVENNMTILPINFQHTVIQHNLPFHHRDPFDRIIIAQAFVEKMALVGNDKVFDSYFQNTLINRVW
jgi:PIN domain nuclease of toxin-antitoxin system